MNVTEIAKRETVERLRVIAAHYAKIENVLTGNFDKDSEDAVFLYILANELEFMQREG